MESTTPSTSPHKASWSPQRRSDWEWNWEERWWPGQFSPSPRQSSPSSRQSSPPPPTLSAALSWLSLQITPVKKYTEIFDKAIVQPNPIRSWLLRVGCTMLHNARKSGKSKTLKKVSFNVSIFPISIKRFYFHWGCQFKNMQVVMVELHFCRFFWVKRCLPWHFNQRRQNSVGRWVTQF